ncbi:MAG: hypothetical protein ACFB0D_15395 [Phormidesmis sp.]
MRKGVEAQTVEEKGMNQQVWKVVISAAACVLGLVAAFTVLFLVPTASMAVGMATSLLPTDHPPVLIAALQSTPFEEQPATLVSPREGSAIPLYIRPAPNQQPVGYGISGDSVTITDQFGDYLMEDDPSATWSHIRLNNAPYTEGWLRGRFLSMDNSEQDSVEQKSLEEAQAP